jgi:hypothetical protein
MKTRFITGIFILMIFIGLPIQGNAQDDNRPEFVAISYTAWSGTPGDETASREEWHALAKEYNEKVTMKNEFVRGTVVLTHMYTPKSSDLLLVTTYNNWGDIEKAQDRNDELEEQAWPDKTARMAFMNKLDRYYSNKHSDEIYATTPGAKYPAERTDTTRVIYMQKFYRAFPEDGTTEEFEALNKEYLEKVTHKNPNLIAFYPMQHGWGADNREIVHVYVLESLEDLSKMNQAWDALEEAAWPKEADRKAFFKKYDRYFTGVHGDFIYSSIPGVSK